MFPLTIWRLLHTPPAQGAWNMALDEALLESVGREDSLPVLRLYAWNPPCLSLGYTQPFGDVNREALVERGWDLVRRPTGGRAILHTDELTYSVIGPQTDPRLSGSVLKSYRILAEALLSALQRLGIPAEFRPEAGAPVDGEPGKGNPVCFEVPSNYEITAQGMKLIGSAQARRKEGVLQHGSLPLTGDLARVIHTLRFSNPAAQREAAQRLLARAATAESLLGHPLRWETAAKAFAAAFSERLNLQFAPSSPTEAELARAAVLVEQKYANPEWTERL